jgi:hypothetical protein
LILAVTCATTVALTACGTSAQPIASGAISTASPSATGSSPAASPTPTPTSTPTPTPKPTKAAPSKTVLGPFGLGPLTLGMSPKEAKATGLVGHVDDPTPGCTTGQLKGASGNDGGLYFSSSVGLAAIYSHGSIATPQGIKLGSTYAQVHAAYPKWSGILDGTAGRGLVKVPGNSAASYRIDISDSTGKVMSLALQAADQDCYE